MRNCTLLKLKLQGFCSSVAAADFSEYFHNNWLQVPERDFK